MSSLNIAQAAKVALGSNADLAKTAAYLEAGRITNNKLQALIAPQLPALVRGYASTPIGKLVFANLLLVGVQKFKPENEVLGKLAYASITQAYAEVFESFDIEGVINGFLNDSSIGKALGIVGQLDAPAAE